jgi:hypothetical protein
MARAAQGARPEVARVEGLQRVADDHATARLRPRALLHASSSSATGTAGGRVAFVRSSLPV